MSGLSQTPSCYALLFLAYILYNHLHVKCLLCCTADVSGAE